MPTTESPHGLDYDRVIAFSDAELAIRLYDTVGQIEEDETATSDALYFLVGETLERFAPDAARAALEHSYRDDDNPDNLLDSIVHMRRQAAARMLRDVVDERDDG